MSMEQIIETVRGFEGVLVVQPAPGDGTPELAWGDTFLYAAPDGRMPERTQPYATIVTKDYPDDTASGLDEPGRWRVNIHVDRGTFRRLVGEDARSFAGARDWSAEDQMLPHPVYGAQSWVCVVSPGPRTMGTVLDLLRSAHDAALARLERRTAGGTARD